MEKHVSFNSSPAWFHIQGLYSLTVSASFLLFWSIFSSCSDISLVWYDCQSMERTQRILHVNVTDTQRLCKSFGVCQGQGARGIGWSGPADLSLGCEHPNSTHSFQQHCHQWVKTLIYYSPLRPSRRACFDLADCSRVLFIYFLSFFPTFGL